MNVSCRLLAILVLLSTAVDVPVSAGTEMKTIDATLPSPLGIRQRHVNRMMQELERKFLQLAQTLERTDPQRAQRLVNAFQQSQQLLLERRMQVIVGLLDSAQLNDAARNQADIITDLSLLITILFREQLNQENAHEENARLLRWSQLVEDLIQKQQQRREESTDVANSDSAPAPKQLEQLAAKQDQTADQTAALGREMAESPTLDSGPSASPPGQQQIAQAQGSMRRASGELRNRNPDAAANDQRSAIEQLQQALDELQQRREKLREDVQNSNLARLTDRFGQMLERQQKATSGTVALDKKKAAANGTLRRPERIALKKLTGEERDLAHMAQEALDLLVDDGSSVVFRRVVANLHGELLQVAELLEDRRTGNPTQDLQREIERTLAELIGALKQAQKAQQAAGGGKGEGGNGRPRLMAGSAELKLLRALQLRVNRRTGAFDQARPAGKLDEKSKQQLRSIAALQEEIATMTQELIQRNR